MKNQKPSTDRTVDSYVNHMKVKLEAFKSFWHDERLAHPDVYPETLPDAEWAEQLASFANW